MTVDIKVPPLGESISEATVAKWTKKVGDFVKADEMLVELETDKVTLEVNAPVSGKISEQLVAEGGTVEVGAILGRIDANASSETAASAKSAPAAALTPEKPTVAANAAKAPVAMLSPAANKIATEHNVQVASGSGKDGRVTKGDVLYAVSSGASAAAHQEPRQERVRMTKLRQKIAQRLKESQQTAAILTTFNEIDMSHVMALRNQYKDTFQDKHKTKLGFMSFFVKATIKALKELPAVNAEIDGDEIVYKNFYDIGVAVGGSQGLVVPIVRNADQLSFAQIEQTIVGLGNKARDGKLTVEDMTGGTFTISNGGVYGSLLSTPIINPPQTGILGLHKIQDRPMVVNGQIVVRPMMYVALSYDHRIIDGKEAVTFLVKIKEAIEDPQRLLLDL